MIDRRPQTESELVDFVRSIDVPAPESLHRSVHALIAAHAERPRPARYRALALLLRGSSSPPRLAAAGDGVSFPYWQARLGWRSTGARTDRIGGRLVRTVFYASSGGRRVGYAIVSGLPAPHVSGGASTLREGVRYRLQSANGA